MDQKTFYSIPSFNKFGNTKVLLNEPWFNGVCFRDNSPKK